MNKIIKNKFFWLVLLLTAVSTGLRLLSSYYFGSFWFDEYWVIYFSHDSLFKMLQQLFIENNLPLFHILLWLWLRLAGEQEQLVRILPIFFGAANIPLLYFVGKKMFSKTAAMMATAFYVFSAFMIFYTMEARSYSLMVFLGLLSTNFYWRLIEGNNKKKYWLGYFVSVLLLSFTHLTGNLLIAAQAIFAISKFFSNKKKLMVWLLNYFYLFLLTAPYFIMYYLVKKDTLFEQYYFTAPYNWRYFIEMWPVALGVMWSQVYFGQLIFWLYFLSQIFLLGSFIFVIRNSANQLRLRLALTPATAFCWLTVAIYLLFCFTAHLIDGRYVMVAMVFMFLLLARGLVNWLGLRRWLLYLVFCAILFLMLLPYSNYFKEHNEWLRINQCLNQLAPLDAKIIVHHFTMEIMMKKYYTGKLPYQGFWPKKDKLTFNERIFVSGDVPFVNEQSVANLAEYVKGYNHIALVWVIYVKALDPQQLVLKWFKENDWQIEDNFCQILNDRVYFLSK